MLADALLRRQNLDELAELFRHDVPAHPDVTVERERLVLRRDEDAAESGIDAVAEREIDDPVGAAEVDGGLGPLLRQGYRRSPAPPASTMTRLSSSNADMGQSGLCDASKTWHPGCSGTDREVPELTRKPSRKGDCDLDGLHGPPAAGMIARADGSVPP